MMQVEVVRDWLDYAEAGLAGVSLISATVAVVVARSSAADSKNAAKAAAATAEVAAQQLQILRDEQAANRALRARRPEFTLRINLLARKDFEQVSDFFVEAEFENVGDGTATHSTLSIMVPENLILERADPEGRRVSTEVLVAQPEIKIISGVDELPAKSLSTTLDLVPQNLTARYFQVRVPRDPGRYQVWVQVEHHEAARKVAKGIEIPMPQGDSKPIVSVFDDPGPDAQDAPPK
jgi:hypothetical protein